MSKNPFLERIKAKGTTGHGRASERRLANEMKTSLASRLTPASGATAGSKGDMALKGRRPVLLEAKSTIHATMTLEFGWLNKIAYEALNKGSMAALAVSFVTPEGKARRHGDWVLMTRADFEELLEETKQ